MVMEPKLYVAAMEGKTDVLRECMNRQDDRLTANNNTVLHVAVQFDQGSACVKEILTTMGSSLLFRENSKGETPLHIAAREGRIDAVKYFIDCAKAEGNDLESGVKWVTVMLRKTNKVGDTALHMAIRSVSKNRSVVVKMLTEENPESSNSANNAEETPLYLAAERNHCDIVSEIVTTCPPSAYGGPQGRTVLHAAVIRCCEVCVKAICRWKQELTTKVDKNGWTPLHYAARFGYGAMVKELLDVDQSVAYLSIADNDDKNTALHIVASGGYEGIMTLLLTRCPDIWEMTNGKGQNILHIAIENEEQNVVKFILGKPWHTNLINQPDEEGNTPLHLFAASNNSLMLDLNTLKQNSDFNAFNKNNLTPLDITKDSDQYTRGRWRIQNFFFLGGPTEHKNSIKDQLQNAGATFGWRNGITRYEKKVPAGKKDEIEKDIRKIADTHLIVAALIATVTFAAGFTMPGGYGNEDPNKGMAVLARQAAFQIFAISNTIAMISSTCAVFFHFIASGYTDKAKVVNRLAMAIYLIIIAVLTMLVAFIAGMFGVLVHSLGLAISIGIIGGLSSVFYYFLLTRAWHDFFM